MKVLSLFSGIGAFEKALDNLCIDYELVNYCEIDKYASKSYSIIHNVPEAKNLWDITKVNTEILPNDIDLVTYGFPCQDISLAGKQKGFHDENGKLTRSGLFFEALRVIEDTKPKIAIAENVKNLTSKKFAKQFEIVLNSLEQAGYNNYWQVLNAKDFGIPQNRERVFIVSIRKDIDNGTFEFPEKIPLKLRLKDMLEDSVDEKFYLSNFQVEKVKLNSNDALLYDKQMIGIEGKAREYNDISRRVYSGEGVAPTIHTCGGGNLEPKVIVGIGEKKSNGGRQWYQQDRIYDNNVAISVTTGFNPYYKVDESQEPLAYDEQNGYIRQDSTVGTLTTDGSSPKHNNRVVEPQTQNNQIKIRKLTPKECWRLMGFDDADIDKCIENGLSNTQLYKQAGNSIVVNVIEALYKKIFSIEE